MRRREFHAAAALGATLNLLATPAIAQVTDLNDAINKAGRQRMLSQRMAKSYLARGQGVLPKLADRTLSGSIALFDRQLAELKAFAPLPEIRSTYAQLEDVWGDYKAALVGTLPTKVQAATVLGRAATVLALAHKGVVQLEKVSGRPVGRLVNISGRQRMLSQRMAAFFFSASWGVQAAASSAEMSKARNEFVAAHELLKMAPEATPGILDELELAEEQFTFFDAALRTLRPGAPDSNHMVNVFTTSERILQVMDGVTGLYSKLS